MQNALFSWQIGAVEMMRFCIE